MPQLKTFSGFLKRQKIIMFKPASLFIGLRYTRAKRRNSFISFISLTSMLGIALGVMTLITVLSVMNGFDREIKKRVFAMVPPITVSSINGYLSDWQQVQQSLKSNPAVIDTAPFVSGEALLTYGSQVAPAYLNGILPQQEKRITSVTEKMIEGGISRLTPGQFGIVLGEELAKRLNAHLGDKITAVTPQMSLTPAGVVPRFKRFVVVGIFSAGAGFGFDGSLAYTNMQDAQKLYGIGSLVSGVHVSINNALAAPQISHELRDYLAPTAYISDWTRQFGAYFHAVKLEKTMMFFILMLIIAVAAFNLVSTLVMVVNDKESDIAI
ncbi:MAG TPA: ABC transporter permease, partial [Gammaproteobacteria bacterium]|nr:ABC transporter permease [Gammaproteobacteria bacterium]